MDAEQFLHNAGIEQPDKIQLSKQDIARITEWLQDEFIPDTIEAGTYTYTQIYGDFEDDELEA